MGTRLTRSVGLWTRCRDEVVGLVWPPRCWLCPREALEGPTCLEHRLGLGLEGARCRRCLGRLGEGIAEGALCAACRRKSSPLGRLWALGTYRSGGGLSTWILALKYGRRPDLARPLGALLGSLVPADLGIGLRGAAIAPVPLHRLRRLERGYDQALLLARGVAQATGLALERPLVRTRRTPPQGSVLGRSRAANVGDAFALKPWRRGALEGRTFLLVDDVYTSGATLSACAGVLRAGGAAGVHGLVLARAGEETA